MVEENNNELATWIRLHVPNKLYYSAKSIVDKLAMKGEEKITIHDKMIELLDLGLKAYKKQTT